MPLVWADLAWGEHPSLPPSPLQWTPMEKDPVYPLDLLVVKGSVLRRPFISYLHFLLIGRFWVFNEVLRRHDTEWRVRPCGQSSEDVQMAMPSDLGFLDSFTFFTQLQKRLAVTLRRFPEAITLCKDSFTPVAHPASTPHCTPRTDTSTQCSLYRV